MDCVSILSMVPPKPIFISACSESLTQAKDLQQYFASVGLEAFLASDVAPLTFGLSKEQMVEKALIEFKLMVALASKSYATNDLPCSKGTWRQCQTASMTKRPLIWINACEGSRNNFSDLNIARIMSGPIGENAPKWPKGAARPTAVEALVKEAAPEVLKPSQVIDCLQLNAFHLLFIIHIIVVEQTPSGGLEASKLSFRFRKGSPHARRNLSIVSSESP